MAIIPRMQCKYNIRTVYQVAKKGKNMLRSVNDDLG
jgi:hypothetical protein